MGILLAYASKHGCTEKCADMLAKKLNTKVDFHNLKKGAVPDLKQYDKIIIGGSVYAGMMHKEVRKFCSKNINELKDKKIGLFICGMRDGEEQINTSFPQELLSIAVAKECFGGEFVFKNMNMIERFIVKKVSKIDKDTSNIKEENINKFAQLMNEA